MQVYKSKGKLCSYIDRHIELVTINKTKKHFFFCFFISYIKIEKEKKKIPSARCFYSHSTNNFHHAQINLIQIFEQTKNKIKICNSRYNSTYTNLSSTIFIHYRVHSHCKLKKKKNNLSTVIKNFHIKKSEAKKNLIFSPEKKREEFKIIYNVK